MKSSFTVGSLYAGVGGICKGFKNSGFKLEWANEIDKNACNTYRHNFEHRLYEEDIWKLDPEKLTKVDVLTAGFPCQPFSVAGYRKGFTDDRGNHFFRILEYINSLGKPKVVFLENVKNLIGHDNGKTFRIIKGAMIENGYSFHAEVLNTKDYGNIPQNRERIYIVCFKNEKDGTNLYNDFKFPSPITLKKNISDILSKNNIDEKFYYRKDKYMFPLLSEEIVKKDTIYQWRRQYIRENKSNVCPTLTANMGTGGHNVPLVLTDNGIRKLTPMECFLFQGYPESFILPASTSNAQLYKQAGNSVSVPVIERIAKNIIELLRTVESQSKLKRETVFID